MNGLFDRIEKKYSKYAIHNLSLYIIIAYGLGYILQLTGTMEFLRLDPYKIVHGEIWRIVTWILVPPSRFDIFTIIMLFFYYSLGTNLERTWGAFKYNMYIFSGMFFTLIGAFAIYVICLLFSGPNPDLASIGHGIGQVFNTEYINYSIFLAFAVMYPDMRILLYFIIPIKIKWIAILYGGIIVLRLVSGIYYGILLHSLFGIIFVIIEIGMSLLNFLIFFFSVIRSSIKRSKRRADFRANMNGAGRGFSYQSYRGGSAEENTGAEDASEQAAASHNAKANVISKHKCAICGRTELDDPDLEFRFCSKCNGNYEYCNNHLFTHVHKE